jgi:hypothetical protein
VPLKPGVIPIGIPIKNLCSRHENPPGELTSEYLAQYPFLLGYEGFQAQFGPDGVLQLFLGDVGPFHHNLVFHHDGRGHREIQGKIIVRIVFGDGLGRHFHLDIILLAQPGHHFLEMLSGLAVGLIVKTADFDHRFSPFFFRIFVL